MAYNKIEANGETLIDLTSDTVTADTLVSGRTAHLASGERVAGTFEPVTGVKGNAESTYRKGDVNLTPANLGLGNVDNTSDLNKPISTATQTALNAQQAQIDDNSEVSEVTDTTPYLYKSSEHDAIYDELVGGSVAWNQLVNPASFANYNSNGITITNNNDGTYTINGTSTARITYDFSIFTKQDNHVYYTKGCPAGGSPRKYWMGYAGYVIDTGNGGMLKNSNSYETRIRMDIVSGVSFSSVTFTPQFYDLTQMFGTTIADYVYSLEQSTAGSGIAWLKSYGFFTKDYYAYSAGGLVSANVSGKKVVGKNLVDIPDKTITAEAYIFNITGLNLLSGTYTFSFNSIGNPITSFAATYEDGTDAVNTNVNNHKLTFTADKKIVSIRLYGAADTYTNMQLELGSTATDYEPYTSITYPIQPTDLRGLYKLNGNKLYTDGDIYSADGQITRKYGYRDYQSGDESRTNAITDGTHTIYKLSAPTTATAQPFASPQMVYRNGTEEYLDTRDVPIPVGGNRKYVDIPDWMVNEYFDDVRAETSTLLVKIENINNGINEIESDMRGVTQDLNDLSGELDCLTIQAALVNNEVIIQNTSDFTSELYSKYFSYTKPKFAILKLQITSNTYYYKALLNSSSVSHGNLMEASFITINGGYMGIYNFRWNFSSTVGTPTVSYTSLNLGS